MSIVLPDTWAEDVCRTAREHNQSLFIIIKTDWDERGHDAVRRIYGPYATEAEALIVNAELRAELPSGYRSHDDYPIDYGVFEIKAAG